MFVKYVSNSRPNKKNEQITDDPVLEEPEPEPEL